jgi:hypothetical protein
MIMFLLNLLNKRHRKVRHKLFSDILYTMGSAYDLVEPFPYEICHNDIHFFGHV